jgi:DNA-directed RNA polymerase subunit K/omega
MEHKSKNVPQTLVTRDINKFVEPTGNIYDSILIMSKRANQIAADMKQAFDDKVKEFSTFTTEDGEVTEEVNNEQAELSKYFEKQPKPLLIAIKEFEDGELTWHLPLDQMEDDLMDGIGED